MRFSVIIGFIIFYTTIISCGTEEARTPLGINISTSDEVVEVVENSLSAGDLLITVLAKADDGSEITYSLESETAEGAVDVDENGNITVLDPTLFSYSLNTEINVTVNAEVVGFEGLSEEILVNILIEEFLDITTDRETLIEIYNLNCAASNTDETEAEDETNENDGTTTETGTENEESIPTCLLDWDIESEEIINWTGVTVTNGRVTALDLSGTEISEIPDNIRRLSDLTSLNLSNNSISTLPENITQLENLITLDLSNNIIGTIPESINSLTTLESFNISNNQLESITENLAELENLTFLDISENLIGKDENGDIHPDGEELPDAICIAFDFNTIEGYIKDDEALCENQGDVAPGDDTTSN